MTEKLVTNFPAFYLKQLDNSLQPWSSCLATSTAMVASWYGIKGDASMPQLEDQIYKFCLKRGLNPQDHNSMAIYLDTKGIDCRVTTDTTIDQLKAHFDRDLSPIILGTLLTPRGHVVVCYGYGSKGLYIADPYGEFFASGYNNNARGIYTLSYASCAKYIYPDSLIWADFVSKKPPKTEKQNTSVKVHATDYFTEDDPLIARIIGYCEGNRNLTGAKKDSYYGHKDPGNFVNNVGSFSSQIPGLSPEQADAYWVGELSKLQAHKIPTMSDTVFVNLLDLYIQAPQAVTELSGYLDRIYNLIDSESKMSFSLFLEHLARQRVECYRDPNTGKLLTTFKSELALYNDQLRRVNALAAAMIAYKVI